MDVLALIRSLFEADTDDARLGILSLMNLDAFEASIRAEGTQISESGDTSDESLGTLEMLGWALDQVEAKRGADLAVEAGNAAAAEAVAAAAARFAVTPEPEVVEPETAEPEIVDPAAVVELASVEPETVVVEIPEVAEPEIVEPVAAAARVPAIDVLRTPAAHQATITNDTVLRITAGADIPAMSLGSEISNVSQVAQAMVARRQALGSGSGSGEKVMVAHLDYLASLPQASDDPHQNTRLIREAGRRDALTASGGFCAPVETIYDFVNISVVEDLVQDYLPTIGAPRGSIQYPDSPDIRDAFTAAPSKAYTNANDIAGASKATTTFACPDFITCTVEAQYEILKFGNFSTRAYPEWVEHWIGLTADVHAHAVSAKLIAGMVNLSNAGVTVGPSGGATASLLSYIGLAAADYRQDLRTGKMAMLNVLCPSYIYDQVRADLARTGAKTDLEALSVPTSVIDSWFAAMNVTLQPVSDWQNVSANSATGASTFPGTMDVLVYAPGTFVRADMGTLDLGLVRDSTLNSTNDYTIFAESFEQVCRPGLESRKYTIATCTNGEFSDLATLICNGTSLVSS